MTHMAAAEDGCGGGGGGYSGRVGGKKKKKSFCSFTAAFMQSLVRLQDFYCSPAAWHPSRKITKPRANVPFHTAAQKKRKKEKSCQRSFHRAAMMAPCHTTTLSKQLRIICRVFRRLPAGLAATWIWIWPRFLTLSLRFLSKSSLENRDLRILLRQK